MEEIRRRCRFCEKEHFGGQRVCRQCIERERERDQKSVYFGLSFELYSVRGLFLWLTTCEKEASKKNETE
jgi:hypothetical protein